MIQGVEQYGNGWIAYSLGNLVFDSDYVAAYPNTDRGFLVSLAAGRHHLNRLTLIPYKMTENYTVESLDEKDFSAFASGLQEISAPLREDAAFQKAWERNIRFRWETEYRQILRDFSRNFFNPDNSDYALRTGNLFTCPTHLEMFQEICRMHLEGKLNRDSES